MAKLPSAQSNLRDADKPLFLADNILATAGYGSGSVIMRTTDLDFNAADQSDSDFPTRRAYCYNRAHKAKSSGSVANCAFLIDAGSGNTLTADALLFEGHNADAVSATVRVRAAASLSGGLLSSPVTIQTATAASADRNVLLWDDDHTYRYWEIYFASAGSQVFEFTQVYLTTQLQMRYGLNRPNDPNAIAGSWADATSEGGTSQRALRHRNRRKRRGGLWLNQDTEKDALIDLESQTSGFSLPFFYVAKPDSAPTVAVFGYHNGAGLDRPTDEGVEFLWELDMLEDMPRMEP